MDATGHGQYPDNFKLGVGLRIGNIGGETIGGWCFGHSLTWTYGVYAFPVAMLVGCALGNPFRDDC